LATTYAAAPGLQHLGVSAALAALAVIAPAAAANRHGAAAGAPDPTLRSGATVRTGRTPAAALHVVAIVVAPAAATAAADQDGLAVGVHDGTRTAAAAPVVEGAAQTHPAIAPGAPSSAPFV